MTKCVVISNGQYLTPRRKIARYGDCRSDWSDHFDDAKVFSNKAAATNSARQNGEREDFSVWEVELCIVGEL